MLFKFGLFWKLVATLFFSWALYFTFGFELCIVTLMSFLLVFQNNIKE